LCARKTTATSASLLHSVAAHVAFLLERITKQEENCKLMKVGRMGDND